MKKKYPEEYRLHELHSDWDRCSLTRSKLYYWINKHKISNEFEAQKQKRKESIISKINLTRLEKIQIILKSIELKKLGIYKFNYMAIKWFLKLYYPKQYRLHLKFNDFERCSKSSIKFLINKFIMYEWESENGWVKKRSWVKKRRWVKKGRWVKNRRKTSRDIMRHQFDWNLKPLSNRLGKKGEKSRKLTL